MLPEREKEFTKIEALILNSLANNAPLSIYICGPPGTGKTATIRAIMQKMQPPKSRQKKIHTVAIDCFASFTEASLSNAILDKLTNKAKQTRLGKKMTLDEQFSKTNGPILILLDEVDNLLTKQKNKIIYTAFNWSSKYPGKVIVIGISNSLDLPERILSKQKFANPPHSIIFPPYTAGQLISILKTQLSNNVPLIAEGVDQKAIELCARKVASMTGDVRRAIDIAAQMLASMAEEEKEEREKDSEVATPGKENALAIGLARDLQKTPQKTPQKNEIVLLAGMKRPRPEDAGEVTPKKNACREVLNAINKTMASPCQRSKLPQHPAILLATLMRLLNSSSSSLSRSPWANRSPSRTPNRDACLSSSTSMSVPKDSVFQAYIQVCGHLCICPLESDELESAYEVLESQAMIKMSKTTGRAGGQNRRVCFTVEMAMARQAINDLALLQSIENINF